MNFRKIVLLVLISLALTSASIINTTNGQVQGVEREDLGIEMFLGIPYAEAPEGALRFKPPVRKAPTEGVYNASSNDKVCPQLIVLPDNVTVTEDCLRLDIYKPLTPAQDTRLPVMIWIHGGSYAFGYSSGYNGFYLAKYDVIVVVINYRLGILGFLDTTDENSVGNFGLRDQCSAIEWVIDNIEAFGGNSSRVTIFGESAGSSSVLQLALSNLCRGKFQRVIAESGTPLSHWAYNNNPLGAAGKLANKSSCPSESGALVKCLREKSIEDIISYQPFALVPEINWFPTHNKNVFPENPLEIMTKGDNSDALRRLRSLDVLLGVNAEEGESNFNYRTSPSLFEPITNLSHAVLGDEEFYSMLRSDLKMYVDSNNADLEMLLPAVKFQYTDWANRDDAFANTRMYIRFLGDFRFVLGDVKTARLHSRKLSAKDTGKTYFYKFNHKPSLAVTYPWSNGATHAEELSFVFGDIADFNCTVAEEGLSRAVMEYWTNFAKTGDPNSPSQSFINTTWPPFNTVTEEYIELDVNMTPDSISKYPYARRFAFWDAIFPSQLKLVEGCEAGGM